MAQFVEITHYNPLFIRQLTSIFNYQKEPLDYKVAEFHKDTTTINVDDIIHVSVIPKSTYIKVLEMCDLSFEDEVYLLQTKSTQGNFEIDSDSYEKIKSVIDIL